MKNPRLDLILQAIGQIEYYNDCRPLGPSLLTTKLIQDLRAELEMPAYTPTFMRKELK